jgi:hypothetical protein
LARTIIAFLTDRSRNEQYKKTAMTKATQKVAFEISIDFNLPTQKELMDNFLAFIEEEKITTLVKEPLLSSPGCYHQFHSKTEMWKIVIWLRTKGVTLEK